MSDLLQSALSLEKWLPPYGSLSSLSALFILFWSRFENRLKAQVDQVVGGGPLTQLVTDIAVGWQVKVALASGYILFIPSWMTIAGPSADFRSTVLSIILFFGFVFVVYPALTAPIDALNRPYTEHIQSRWRRGLRKLVSEPSDAKVYIWMLAIPHLLLIAVSWYYQVVAATPTNLAGHVAPAH